MSASNRDKRSLPRPRLVEVVYAWSTGPDVVHPALLLEWRRVERPGRADRWEGLVCMAKGGGEQAWSVELRWVLASELRPVG